MNNKPLFEKATLYRTKVTDSTHHFKKNRLNIAGYNLVALDKTIDLIKRMHEHKIQIMVLKGIALIENVYRDISQRKMEDVDILIKPENLDKAREIFAKEGYILLGTNQANSEVYSLEEPVRIYLDLHWRLVNQNSPSQKYVYWPDENLIWQRAVNITLGQQAVLTMCLEDLLVYLCFHALKERFLHKKWLEDINLIINSNKGEIDWEKFLDIARDSGTDKLCCFIMEYQKKEYAVDIPGSVLSRIKKNYGFYFFEERIFHFSIRKTKFMKELLWPLAMNDKKKKMLFFKRLPVYLWKKLRHRVFVSYEYQ